MGMMINRRRVMGGKSLPYDAEIEYLESTGTQWIDTGIKATNGCIQEYRAKYKQYVMIFGSLDKNTGQNTDNPPYANRNTFVPISSTMVSFQKTNVFNSIQYNFNLSDFYEIYFDTTGTNFEGKINGVTIESHSGVYPLNPTTTIKIFRSDYSGNKQGYMAWSKITNANGLLVWDAIPVRIGTTGYMYNKVSKQLFGNAGTGAFILGPDK